MKQVDAWLVAKGNVNTCGGYEIGGEDDDGGLNADRCKDRVIINGPVYAGGQIDLLRTYGADKNEMTEDSTTSVIAEEAERINLPGSSIIFAGKEATSSEPNTTYLKKMPVRY